MSKTFSKISISILVSVCVLALSGIMTGCQGEVIPGGTIVSGSGNLETRDLNLTDFTKIDINQLFQVDITRSDMFLVRITADDNLFAYLDVNKSGSTLNIGLKHNISYRNTTQKASIQLPSLRYLNVDGASRADVSGFQSEDSMDFRLSGAGRLEIADFKSGKTSFDSSGASRINGSITTGDIKFVLSGATVMELEGSGKNMSLEASGASRFTLSGFVTTNADVNISGGTSGEINASGTISGDVSGGSRLYYVGEPENVKTRASGGSTVSRK